MVTFLLYSRNRILTVKRVTLTRKINVMKILAGSLLKYYIKKTVKIAIVNILLLVALGAILIMEMET